MKSVPRIRLSVFTVTRVFILHSTEPAFQISSRAFTTVWSAIRPTKVSAFRLFSRSNLAVHWLDYSLLIKSLACLQPFASIHAHTYYYYILYIYCFPPEFMYVTKSWKYFYSANKVLPTIREFSRIFMTER